MSDTLNLANSIWPNGMKVDSDGHAVFYPLGTNKTLIPTSSSQWPKGNKIISPFVYQDDKLVGFVDTKALTTDSQITIYLPYEHIEAEFPAINKGRLQIHAPNATIKKASWKDSGVEDIPEVQYKYKGCKTVAKVKTVDANYKTTDIVDGVWTEPLWDLEHGSNGNWNGAMFYNCYKLTSFSSDLSSLTDGIYMFGECHNLTTFKGDLSSLTIGDYMFCGCDNLTSFAYDLSSLTNGEYMFSGCYNLESFTSDLSNLMNGENMFNSCYNLMTFTSDSSGSPVNLSSLTDGTMMFQECYNLTSFTSDLPNLMNAYEMFNNCINLTTFTSDLSSLTDGTEMFWGCENLTSFTSNLSSLTNGDTMFENCKLDAPSVKNIIDTINTFSGSLCLGIGCYDTTEDKDLFAQEVGYSDMASLLDALQTKGWDVSVQYNDRPTTTYGLRRLSEDTLPVFVKLIETEEHADYTSLDDSKKFILKYFHETTGSTDGYTQFNSLEEAIETLNIKPIENQ